MIILHDSPVNPTVKWTDGIVELIILVVHRMVLLVTHHAIIWHILATQRTHTL
jgi:hypothetical protein